MVNKVLILGNAHDGHVVAVKAELDELKVPTDLFRFEQFLDQSSVSFNFGNEKNNLSVALANGDRLELPTYTAIWHRRPGFIKSQKFPMEWIRTIMTQEANSALWGSFYSLSCLWVNHPARDNMCLEKLWQLDIATKAGLLIPDTLITNDPEQARAFYAKHDKQVVYKMISEQSHSALPKFELPGGVPTLHLRDADDKHLDQVKLGAHLFQQRVRKAFDVRTTVMGKKVFSFKIDSQSGSGKLDWRHDYSVSMSPYELPDDVYRGCVNLMARMGLNYGAIDFCVTPEGEHVFLEINCAGQFLWLEHKTKMKLAKELALLLAGESEPLVAPEPEFIQDFSASTRQITTMSTLNS